MGSTVLIFGGIALAWLAYFATQFRRGGPLNSADAATQLASAIPVFHSDEQRVDDHGKPIDLSTPLTRRAELADIRAIDRTAARRRRMFLVISLGLVATGVVLGVTGHMPWWAMAVPGVVFVGVMAFNRVSVRVLRRQLDARFEALTRAHDEETVALDAAPTGDGTVTVDAVPAASADLWEPLPITQPTYVSRPLAPRTVRTIDLSAPASPTTAPVTADAPESPKVTQAPKDARGVDGQAKTA